MSPSSGRFISRTRKIAADIEHAQMNNTTTDMALRGANNPKLTNRRVTTWAAD